MTDLIEVPTLIDGVDILRDPSEAPKRIAIKVPETVYPATPAAEKARITEITQQLNDSHEEQKQAILTQRNRAYDQFPPVYQKLKHYPWREIIARALPDVDTQASTVALASGKIETLIAQAQLMKTFEQAIDSNRLPTDQVAFVKENDEIIKVEGDRRNANAIFSIGPVIAHVLMSKTLPDPETNTQWRFPSEVAASKFGMAKTLVTQFSVASGVTITAYTRGDTSRMIYQVGIPVDFKNARNPEKAFALSARPQGNHWRYETTHPFSSGSTVAEKVDYYTSLIRATHDFLHSSSKKSKKNTPSQKESENTPAQNQSKK